MDIKFDPSADNPDIPPKEDDSPPVDRPFHDDPQPAANDKSVRVPIPAREYIGLLLAVILCDITIYHGGGYAGYGVFLFLMPPILFFCARAAKTRKFHVVVYLLIALLACRLLSNGSDIGIGAGFFLMAAFGCALAGRIPLVGNIIFFAAATLVTGAGNALEYAHHVNRSRASRSFASPSISIPLLFLLLFGLIFTMANPILKNFLSKELMQLIQNIQAYVPSFSHILFWCGVIWVTSGLLNPPGAVQRVIRDENMPRTCSAVKESGEYGIWRNTLAGLVCLFAGYLVFEFYYLWWKDIPQGFRYSEYAHQGAAWLTLALAVSTFLLGIVFRNDMRSDPRVVRLKKVVRVWSVENFTLALCAYHRLWIYIQYNGLSRMRVIGIFGASVVVAGFCLVVLMVAKRRNLAWVISRQLLALALTIYLLIITPVDWFTTRYNVGRILSGDHAPSVQLAYHRIGPDGILEILPLLESDSEDIRDGVRGLLARTQDEFGSQRGWTHYQIKAARVQRVLGEHQQTWAQYSKDRLLMMGALERFRTNTRKWYD